jgi:hypothetical protein
VSGNAEQSVHASRINQCPSFQYLVPDSRNSSRMPAGGGGFQESRSGPVARRWISAAATLKMTVTAGG